MTVNSTHYHGPGSEYSYTSTGGYHPRGRYGGRGSARVFTAGWPGFDQGRQGDQGTHHRVPRAQPTTVAPDLQRDSGPTVKSCFISHYSVTDIERTHVLCLADCLRDNGVNTMVDIYQEDDPPESWASWVEQEITTRDVTLLVCSQEFNDKRLQRASFHMPGRVHFEGAVMYSLLANPTPKRFLPVFLGDNPPRREFIPPSLQGTRVYHLKEMPPQLDAPGHEDFTALYAYLTGQNRTAAPPIGKVVKLS